MNTLPVYSQVFSCLYDEQDPVGQLGRGTHYSVFRCVEWLNVVRSPLAQPEIHDFAVIWDEDHDTRVIQAVEQIYMAGLLSPVQFIGERKGCLTLILAARFYYYGSEETLANYKSLIQEISFNFSFDSWTTGLGSFDKNIGSPQQTFSEGIIAADENRVLTYLRNIDSLWDLGTKPFSPSLIEVFN